MSLEFKGHRVVDLDWDGRGVDSFFSAGAWEYSLFWGLFTWYREMTDSELEELTDSFVGQDYLVTANMEGFGYYRK